uniref:Ovule protein n=1 Tax=Heterorhabditis bacteriophora TaxID=37862 RepID=A0A1I7W7T1_HETBA
MTKVLYYYRKTRLKPDHQQYFDFSSTTRNDLLPNSYITTYNIKTRQRSVFILDKSSERTNCSLVTLPTVDAHGNTHRMQLAHRKPHHQSIRVQQDI